MLFASNTWLHARLSWSGFSSPRSSVNPILAGSTLRFGGCSGGIYSHNNLALHVGDEADAVRANRQSLQSGLGAAHIQWLNQVHGSRCIRSSLPGSSDTPQADAMWTDMPGVALAVLTADCVPVLLAAADGSVVGAAHAGWRGLRDGVIDELVECMPVANEDLRAWIGPSISETYYEVGEDVWSHFVQSDAECLLPCHDHPGKRMLKLNRLADNRLRALGIACVEQCQSCTFANEQFYSYRRSRQRGYPETGRMASVIMLQPAG